MQDAREGAPTSRANYTSFSVINSNHTGNLSSSPPYSATPSHLMTNHTTPIIFNMWTQNTLGTESASAFVRHAFGCFYDAFSQIDLTNKPFIPTLVFHEALLSLRLASPSSATPTPYNTIRILYIKRRLRLHE